MKIVCVGDVCIDRYVDVDRDLRGGVALNFAMHARRAFEPDDEVHVISAIGNDEAGRGLADYLRSEGVVSHLAVLPGDTAIQPIRLRADGEREFFDYRAGVLSSFVPDAAARAVIADADLVVAPLHVQIAALFDAAMTCHTRGLRAVDFADIADDPRVERVERYIDSLDIAFFGVSAFDTELIDALRALARRWRKLFVITLGAEGSIAVSAAEETRCPAARVESVIDTTGAGDSFAAGFLAAYMRNLPLDAALEAGAERAAVVISRVGAS